MIEIDGFWWFVGALLICGWHMFYLRGWRREHREGLARWRKYDADAQKRHEEFMRAMTVEDRVDVSWNLYKSERGQA